jgi:hypothetical protein
MAANREQGRYLVTFLTAFTGFVAGLVLWAGDHAGLGVIVTLASILLMGYSLVGFRRIKPFEFQE